MSNWPITTTNPTARNTTIAPTFAIAAQNSNSPNARADNKLITNTTAREINTVAHVGINGHQYWMYNPTADSSAIPVNPQFNQYNQPVTNAAASPKNSRMYDTNAPEVARCNTNSPNARIKKYAITPTNA